MVSNKKIKNRISKLLEFKSNEFRKKYYLLSFLAETKISKNKNLINEFECFCNALIESNANKPSLDSINNLLKNSFMLSIKNEKLVESKIQNLNKLISYKFKQDLNESIIDEELNNIDIKNVKLDLKLIESIKFAVKNNISFLYESYEDDDSDADVEDAEESSRSARKAYFDELKRQNELLFGKFDEVDDVDDLHDTESQLLPTKQKKSITARLKDKSKVAATANQKDEFPTYPNAEKYATYDDVFLKTVKADKYDSKVKKPIFSKADKIRRLAFNSLENNSDKRKFYIIDEIKKYLYILRIPNITSAETKSLYDQEALKLQRTSNIINTMSALASGLTEDKAQKIKLEFAKYLDDKNYMLNLMKESDLLKILVKAAGPVKRQNVTDFMKFLNLEYPKSGVTGDEYELKDDEKDIDSDVSSFNTAERLSDTETDILQKYNEYYDDFMRNHKGIEKPIEIEEFEKLSSSEIEQLLFDTKNAVEKDEYYSDDKSFETKSAEENIETVIEVLDDYGLIKQTSDGGIKISLDGSKFNPKTIDRQQYLDALEKLKALKELVKTSSSKAINLSSEGKMSAEQIEDYFNKLSLMYVKKGRKGGLTLNDIAAASRGNYSGGSGVKRTMINAWNKLSFYSILDVKQKSKIYELCADRYFEGLEKAGLIKDAKEDEDDDEAFVSLEAIDTKIDSIINAITTVKETDTPEKIKKKEEIKQKHEQYKKEYADMLASIAHVYENVKDTLIDRKLLEAYFDGSLYEEVKEMGVDYNGRARKLIDDLGVVSKYLIIEQMLFKQSSFRIFVSEIFDEFFKLNYASIDIERQLGKQVKDFFTKYYPSAGIDKSGNVTGETDVESCAQDEGRMLFNPIVRWIIGKTGFKFARKKMKSVASQEQSRKVFFINNFVDIVRQYNEKYAKNKLMSIDGVEEFNEDDALFIYDDIVSNNGLIGSFVKDNLTNAADELYEKLEDYIMRFDDKTLIENVITSLAYQELHTKNKKLFTTGKEETEARNAAKDSLKDYYKTFAKDIQAIKDEY